MKHATGEVVTRFRDSIEEGEVPRIFKEIGATVKKSWMSRRGLRAIASVPPGEETSWAKTISEHPAVLDTHLNQYDPD